MSRSKKSRKPGGAPTAKPKLSKAELASVEKRARKKTGNKPGNRQQEAQPVKSPAQNANQLKDPRIGNKKPIELGSAAKLPQTKPKVAKVAKVAKAKQDPIAAIRTMSNDSVDVEANLVENLDQELANIEADERLQAILAKQEDELALTEQEVDYFNDMMERHQQISAQLDEDETDDVEVSNTSRISEDDLWDKLDNSSLPDPSNSFLGDETDQDKG
ncbi:MAG: GTPase-activating protein [Colwellia sp.]|nr:GTPase-activating protein [Colwellia sp.]